MKRLLSIFLFTGLCLTSYSQETTKMTYYGRVSAGVLTGERSSLSLQLSNGIALNHFDIGLGLGLEEHDGSSYAPIMLESRYNFGRGATRPFVGINAGYLAALNGYYSYSGGYTGGINVGFSHYFTKHFGISTTIGYRYSYTVRQFTNWLSADQNYYYGQNVIRDMHRLEFRVGVVFR